MRFEVYKGFTNLDVPEEMFKTWDVVRIDPKPRVIVAQFVGGFESEGYIPMEIAPLLAGDYCDFLNDKYVDKEFNAEWGSVNVKERIQYHKNQIEKLKIGKFSWNSHGTGIE
jgi:hypothetical protein